METKPYSLQSPEQIAKDYGGNKQKIAEAMQMGILDPTAGTLAAMFIDRMRSAAQTEAAPQQTVAQQVFAPPMPQMPAGLGATPQAAAMPAPAEAMMGAPSAQAVPGMAEGGMVPPYMAGGGLTDLPLPDGMFDEPSNGGFNDGYRGGGLVAFKGGTDEDGVKNPNAAKDSEAPPENEDPNSIIVNGQRIPKNLAPLYKQGVAYVPPSPEFFGGLKSDLYGNVGVIEEVAPRETTYAKQIQDYYNKLLDPEEQRKRRQEDIWAAVGKAGRAIASTPGSLLQAASAGMGEASEALSNAAKERRGEERIAQQARVAEERTGNKELMDRANAGFELLKSRNDLNKAFQEASFRNELERLGIDAEILKTRILAGTNLRQALIEAASRREVGGMEFSARKAAAFDNLFADRLKNAPLDPEYQKRFKVNPNDANRWLRQDVQREINSQFGGNDPAGIRGGQ